MRKQRTVVWTDIFLAWINENRNRITVVFVATFLIGFWAHGFGISNLNLNHDTINHFQESVELKISGGRVFDPVYRVVTAMQVEMPWSHGIVGFFEISFAVFLICEMLHFTKPIQIIVTAGIMVVNTTIMELVATYHHEIGGYCFALLSSVISAFCWHRFTKSKKMRCLLFGAVFLCISLGLYQAYIATYIVVVLLVSIHLLLSGERAKDIVYNGLCAIAIILVAGVLYWIAVKGIVAVTGFALHEDGYNSLSNVSKNEESFISRIFYSNPTNYPE